MQAPVDATLSAAQSVESNRLLLSSLHFAFLQSAFTSDCANCPARDELGFLELIEQKIYHFINADQLPPESIN